MTKITSLSLIASAILWAAGCGGALLDKADPLDLRYFAPTPKGPALAPSTGAGAPLRLGRIEASAHLRERMAYRASEHEIGFYETSRWAELPEAYFRRALSRQLFESGSFERVVAGGAPTLEVELLAFEAVRPKDAARVEARVLVHDGRRVLLERSIRAEQALQDDDPAAIAAALSRALEQCVAEIERVVGGALSALPSRSAPPVSAETPS